MKKATASGMGKRGAPAKDVDAYIAGVLEPARSMLEKLRRIIKAAAPQAVEVISYHLPLYKHHGHLVAFSAFKNHCGFYVMSTRLMAAYKEELEPYEKATATVRFPIGDPIPAALVKKVVKARIKENEAHAKAWRSSLGGARPLAPGNAVSCPERAGARSAATRRG